MLRRLKDFEYHKPSTLTDALTLLNRHGDKARVLAGGTDLLVGMKEKGVSPDHIVDIKGIGGLDAIRYDSKKGLSIGALATMSDVVNSPQVRNHYSFLSSAAEEVGSVQVRNRATIGGNLCNAAPSAETAPPLLCLDAEVRIASIEGERTLSLEDFFRGPGMTALNNEILVEILLPPSARNGVYIKHGARRAMDIAVVGVAAAVTQSADNGPWEEVRIALGAVAPTPLRVEEAENILAGTKPDAKAITEAAEAARDAASPIFDVRASNEYRREMVYALVRRALNQLS
jgi:carbon-monoxide dehydrogenase medium subunit